MTRVKVTFYLEANEPDHYVGLTNETYEKVEKTIRDLGGEDIDFEKEDDE